jgi:hypothetical protein
MLLLLSLLIFGVLAVVACGGDDDDDTGGDDGGAQTSAPADNGDDGGEEETDAPDDGGEETDAPDDGDDDGGDDGGGGDFDAAQVCDILSKEDVETAFGVSMHDAEYIPLPDAGGATIGSCSYVSAETSDSYSLTVYAAADEAAAQALFLGACPGSDSAGVGQASCWFSEAHTEIWMLAGSNAVNMFVTTVDGDAEAISTTLASLVYDQIGG